jgi:site-specific DNA-methyltransferase (adenine-specific)
MYECRRLLTPDGSFWVLIGDEYAAEFALMLKNLDLTIRSWVKWYETFGVNCSNNFNRCSRHLFYCVNDAKRFVFNADAVTRPSDRQAKYQDGRADPGGKLWDNVWQIPRLVGTAKERIPDFPTQLPLALLNPIVLCVSEPGDLVVDPFAGSATTGEASLAADRRFLGIEQSADFVRLARLRLKGVASGG